MKKTNPSPSLFVICDTQEDFDKWLKRTNAQRWYQNRPQIKTNRDVIPIRSIDQNLWWRLGGANCRVILTGGYLKNPICNKNSIVYNEVVRQRIPPQYL